MQLLSLITVCVCVFVLRGPSLNIWPTPRQRCRSDKEPDQQDPLSDYLREKSMRTIAREVVGPSRRHAGTHCGSRPTARMQTQGVVWARGLREGFCIWPHLLASS